MNLIISFEVNGVHYWPNAPEEYKEFRMPHRHLFRFVVWVPVSGSRSSELFNVRKFLISTVLSLYPDYPSLNGGTDFGPSSCEEIATKLKAAVGASKVFVGEEYWLGAEV